MAAESASDTSAFSATGRAYVRFALAHPALFRLIFTHLPPAGETVFGDSMAARMLHDKAATATGGGGDLTAPSVTVTASTTQKLNALVVRLSSLGVISLEGSLTLA